MEIRVFPSFIYVPFAVTILSCTHFTHAIPTSHTVTDDVTN